MMSCACAARPRSSDEQARRRDAARLPVGRAQLQGLQAEPPGDPGRALLHEPVADEQGDPGAHQSAQRMQVISSRWMISWYSGNAATPSSRFPRSASSASGATRTSQPAP